MKPLTVAWCTYFPVEWLPGAPEVVSRLPKRHPASWQQACAEEFKQHPGLKLHIIEVSRDLPHDVTFEWGNITFHCLKTGGGWRAPSLFWVDTFLIRRLLKQVRPDVVHAWGTERGAALVASRLPYPYLVSLQGLLEYFGEIFKLSKYNRLMARLERVALRRAKVASGESTFVVKWLRDHYPRLEVHHVEHSPGTGFYGLPRIPRTEPRELLAVGAMGHRKGTDLLLLALDQLKDEIDFHLTLIGFAADPGFIEGMKARTSRGLWDRVEILQTPPTSVVAERMSSTTLVLFPTRADTGPVAVKEAVVAGIPVVGSIMGGIPDYIAPGKNGFVFPPGDLPAFVHAIRKAWQHPLFSKGLVDQRVLVDVKERLAPRRMAEQFLAIYQKLASTKNQG